MAISCYIYQPKKERSLLAQGSLANRAFNFALSTVILSLLLFITSSPASLFPSKSQLISPIVSQSQTSVLGAKTVMAWEDSQDDFMVAPSITPTSTPTPTPQPALPKPTSEEPPVFTPARKSYKIAIIGDSMVDTMGERLEFLEHALKRRYPYTNFELYNYGTGAQTVDDGLGRFYSAFDYKDRHFAPLPAVAPDILIVASFAYNPFTPYDRDRHWIALSRLVEAAKGTSAQVYVLAENAPLKRDFGKGPLGVNWEESTAYEHATRIIEQLENAVGVARSLDVPLINAFYPSIVNGEKEGKRAYVNPGDGIHPSVAGHEFIANLIVSKIRL